MHILLVGMGDTSRRIVPLLQAKGHHVSGIRRHPRGDEGCLVLAQDIHQPDLSALAPIDWVYVILSPDQMDANSYQRTYVESVAPLTHALRAHPIQRIVFVSSTSVYGQNAGEWINEHSPTQPQRFNGQLLLQAERAWQQAWPDRVTVVRPSGIYSAERRRLYRLIEQGKPIATQAWSNRIHIDDLAAFLAHLVEVNGLEHIYLASDDVPVELDRILQALAGEQPLPRQAAAISGKRILNFSLKRTGFQLKYPSWQSGYLLQ